jgi:hypothetical protein
VKFHLGNITISCNEGEECGDESCCGKNLHVLIFYEDFKPKTLRNTVEPGHLLLVGLLFVVVM